MNFVMSEERPRLSKLYHGFGGRLNHEIPAWARDDAIYHIRVRCAAGSPLLTQPEIADRLLESVKFYHEKGRWWTYCFLLMPDHWHGLLSFGPTRDISKTIGEWKSYHARRSGIVWQENYFDHRLRNHLAEFDAKYSYIRRNPVVVGLCARPEDWPWQWHPVDLPPDTRPG
jgi:REP element-mobilizing transposase RayT